MTLTKAHLVDSIHKVTGRSRLKSATLIDSIFEIMKQTLEGGEDILISGFGKFCVKEKNSRRGRNPQTGNDLILGARRAVIFRCSTVLKDKINREIKFGQPMHCRGLSSCRSEARADIHVTLTAQEQRGGSFHGMPTLQKD